MKPFTGGFRAGQSRAGQSRERVTTTPRIQRGDCGRFCGSVTQRRRPPQPRVAAARPRMRVPSRRAPTGPRRNSMIVTNNQECCNGAAAFELWLCGCRCETIMIIMVKHDYMLDRRERPTLTEEKIVELSRIHEGKREGGVDCVQSRSLCAVTVRVFVRVCLRDFVSVW